MTKRREPSPKPGAEPKRITIKTRAWESEPERQVDLIPHEFASDEWEVYLPDGAWIGTVGRYTGSLDRKIKGTRLRHPGKRRTLWYVQGTHKHSRPLYGQVSRADCTRVLIRDHERGGAW